MAYTSQYPTEHTTTYVKATSEFSASWHPWYATDPTKSLTGEPALNSWLAGATTNQRFHIDLGSAKIIKRLYFEGMSNPANQAGYTGYGVQNFTFWGSNDSGAFAELTYATDTNWTQLTTSITAWARHVQSDVEDPQYATVTNTTAYRYYAMKCADNWGSGDGVGMRRLELQTEDGGAPAAGQFLTPNSKFW